jgi:hypothetical protein
MKVVLVLLAILLLFLAVGPASGAEVLKQVRAKHEKKLLDTEGVTGVFDDPVANEIVVMVERPEHVRKVPEKIDGIGVRVLVTGKITALDTAVAVPEAVSLIGKTKYSRKGMYRPVFAGISLGGAGIPGSCGTLGLVVRGTDGKTYALSNAHVLAMTTNAEPVSVGTPAWQPGGCDRGSAAMSIGTLAAYIPIDFTGETGVPNTADAAIALLDPSAYDSTSYGKVLNLRNNGFYTVSGTTTVGPWNLVRKSGRTSGVSYAFVLSDSATVRVQYTTEKIATFTDQIITTVMSRPGDSGSPVDLNGKFVGLLFAGSNTITVVCKAGHLVGPLGIIV